MGKPPPSWLSSPYSLFTHILHPPRVLPGSAGQGELGRRNTRWFLWVFPPFQLQQAGRGHGRPAKGAAVYFSSFEQEVKTSQTFCFLLCPHVPCSCKTSTPVPCLAGTHKAIKGRGRRTLQEPLLCRGLWGSVDFLLLRALKFCSWEPGQAESEQWFKKEFLTETLQNGRELDCFHPRP